MKALPLAIALSLLVPSATLAQSQLVEIATLTTGDVVSAEPATKQVRGPFVTMYFTTKLSVPDGRVVKVRDRWKSDCRSMKTTWLNTKRYGARGTLISWTDSINTNVRATPGSLAEVVHNYSCGK